MPIPVKIILGLMTLWGALFALAALAGDYALVPPPGSSRTEVSGIEALVIYLNAGNALLIFLIYTFIAFGLRRLPAGRRCLWIAAFAFFYPLAMPAFWWLHIWRAPRSPPRADT